MPNNRVNLFMYGRNLYRRPSGSRSSSATTGIPSRSSQSELGVSPSTFHPHTQVSPVGATSTLYSGEISSRVNMENPASSMPGHFPEPEIVFVSLSTTCSEDNSNEAKELLEQLNSLKIKQANLQEVVADIYHMGAQILLHDEGDDKFDDGGVSIHIFIPFTTNIVRQTVFSVESYIKTLENPGTHETKSSNLKKFFRKPVLRRLVPNKLTKSNDNAHELFTITLVELHTQMKFIHFIAMPYEKPSTHSEKMDNILATSASIGKVLSVLFDSVPVLGMLKPAAGALSGICTAVQTFRSNKEVAAEILDTVRDDIRWVIRKIQKDTSRMAYMTEECLELGKDVSDYFQKLNKIIDQTFSKQTRTWKSFRSISLIQMDKLDLEDLESRIRDARDRFQFKLAFATHGTNCAILDMTGGIITKLDHNAVNTQHVNDQLLNLMGAMRFFFFTN